MNARTYRPQRPQRFTSSIRRAFRNAPRIPAFFIVLIVFMAIFSGFQMFANPQTQTCEINNKWSSKDGFTIASSCGLMTPHPFHQSAFFDMERGKTYKINTTGFIFPVVHQYEEVQG